MDECIVSRLLKRAEIRRQIPGRKSVAEGKPDRIADLLEEAAEVIMKLEIDLCCEFSHNCDLEEKLQELTGDDWERPDE